MWQGGFCVILLTALLSAQAENYPKLLFTSCALPGWSCVNDTDGLSSSIASVAYKCTPTTVEKTRIAYRPVTRHQRRGYNNFYETETETYSETYTETIEDASNYTLTLSDWDKLPLTAITVSGCGEIVLNMHTVSSQKIHTLRVENILQLTIVRPKGEQLNHPKNIVLKNIKSIPVMPPGFIAHESTKKVEITKTIIDLMKTKAIQLKSPLESFEWVDVKVRDMRAKSLSVKMEDDAQFHIKDSDFPALRTASILVEGGETLVESSSFRMLLHASIRIYSPFVKFTRNEFNSHHGDIFVQSPDVAFTDNQFKDCEPRKLIKWTTHSTTSNAPDQVSYLFGYNKIWLPSPRDVTSGTTSQGLGSLEQCFTRTTFIEKTSSCFEASTEPSGPWMYSLPKNLTVANLVVCQNPCYIKDSTNISENCQIPYSWDIVNVWPQPLCTQTTTPETLLPCATPTEPINYI